MGKFVEARLHELERESKMRLLKTRSHTFEHLGYEADKERQGKRERRLIHKGQEKRQEKPPPHHLKGVGGGGRVCRRKSEKPK